LVVFESCFMKASKLPKSRSIARRSSPVGSSPPCGLRLFQKMEWRMWPERWKARFLASMLTVEKSSFARASSSFSRVVLAPAT